MSVSALTALVIQKRLLLLFYIRKRINISCRDVTKSSSHSKHLENQHALGLTISSQIFCDNMSQCINIAAKDRCWLANFFLLKKVELAFPGHGETEALLLYHPPMGYSTCTLSPTTTFHGTKTFGSALRATAHDDLEEQSWVQIRDLFLFQDLVLPIDWVCSENNGIVRRWSKISEGTN